MQTAKTPLIDAGDAAQKRAEIKAYFNLTWDTYERLFECIASDAGYYLKGEALRHPLIFYLGHTAVFYINKLRVAKILQDRVDERIESMLAIGVDEMSWDDLDEANYDWPRVDEVMAYRRAVRAQVNDLIDALPLNLPIGWNDPFWIILMGIEHERIHLETSSVLIRQLPLDCVSPHPRWPLCPLRGEAPDNALVHVPGGDVVLGRDGREDTYGWDNEYGRLAETVAGFSASRTLVSNREFLDFVEDGGYRDKQWWSDEGWQWRKFKKARHPVFWLRDGAHWRYRAMTEVIDMPWNWPVDVNQLEAKAYCNWMSAKKGRSIRLPSEAEWQRMYDEYVQQDYPLWPQAPANINLEHWASACPVDRFAFGPLYDIIGNVWQWTESAIDGLAGFRVHPAYDDFSVPTFDGKHNLIKGGSWISTGNEALKFARYAFRRHFFQHAGFRYIESDKQVTQQFNTYETDELISQYLEFHYGEPHFGVANFPQHCVEIIAETLGSDAHGRALDIGCAVGRSAFELARHFEHVDAIDFSTRFIRNALNLRQHGSVKYMIPDEGELCTARTVHLHDLGLGDAVARVDFAQGDACNLKDKFTGYDLIFAGNLIDRLYNPRKFLQDMLARLNPGGWLVLTSPYTWLEEYTDKSEWLGGVKVHGENLTTLDALKRALQPRFSLHGVHDVPFVIRETARKFQHTIAQMTLWKLNDSKP